MAKSIRDLESLIEGGVNPLGMTAQTANGTAHATGTGWNYDPPWQTEQTEPQPAWPAGRNNRTAE